MSVFFGVIVRKNTLYVRMQCAHFRYILLFLTVARRQSNRFFLVWLKRGSFVQLWCPFCRKWYSTMMHFFRRWTTPKLAKTLSQVPHYSHLWKAIAAASSLVKLVGLPKDPCSHFSPNMESHRRGTLSTPGVFNLFLRMRVIWLIKIMITHSLRLTFGLNLCAIFLSCLNIMTSLHKCHDAFIVINANLCDPLKKASWPSTGPGPPVKNHCLHNDSHPKLQPICRFIWHMRI